MTATNNSDDLFRQAMRAWETAADAGVKMQEESANWVRQMFCESSTLSDWYAKGQTAIGDALGKTQENIDEAIQLLNQQAESSVKLLQKAFEVRQNENPAEAPQKLVEWWRAALDTMRKNSQATLQANSNILSTWSKFARQVNCEAADTMADLARKTADQAEKMTKSAVEHAKETVGAAAGNPA